MKMKKLTFLVAGALTALAIAACSSDDANHDDTHGHAFPDCEAISEACHEADDDSGGTPTQCHTLAHDAKSEAECTPRKASCIAACQAATGDGGAAADANATDQ